MSMFIAVSQASVEQYEKRSENDEDMTQFEIFSVSVGIIG